MQVFSAWYNFQEIACFAGIIIIQKISISNFRQTGQTIWIFEAILLVAVAHAVTCMLINGNHNYSGFYHYLPNRIYFSSTVSHGLWEKYELSVDILNIKKSFGKKGPDC